MENKKENGKTKEVLKGFVNKAADVGKKAVDGVQKGVKDIAEKNKNEAHLRKIKKYNPLFPEDYTKESFNLPNMIQIVDDAVRRGIDVCEGAIGWLSSESGMEVLHLYDEAVTMSKIQFIPNVECDAIYYVDNFDRNRFIKVDCIFSRAHDERLAELKHVAHSLGAKRCSIEMVEGDSEVQSQSLKMGVASGLGKLKSNESYEHSASSKRFEQRRGRILAEFEGNNAPQKPELKWFANDDNVKRLIEMRCTSSNSIKSELLELEGSSSAAMSQKTASAIDIAVSKIGTKSNFNMEKHATKENHSKLIFCIEF
ncbi:MAG: hypothetical protein E7606_00140 [Ruminococcaceae bacterium]|nr:hypothetical protein [Oscillospiraceae bacterium]